MTRYRRLWRLPSPRAIGTGLLATGAAASAGALLAPAWGPAAAVVTGALGTVGYARRHRHRIALEVRMARALLASGPQPRNAHLAGLREGVRAEVQPDGVTRLTASSWLDAVRALGFVMVRDRGFQMELLRRTARGRLAEVWGPAARAGDEHYRALDLACSARRAAGCLASPERALLEAFSSGANDAFAQLGPPFECRFLSYEPDPWIVEDSLLVALHAFYSLSWNATSKRAEAAIRHAFPDDVARFFLPGAGGGDGAVPEALGRFRETGAGLADVVVVDRPAAGSNCWVVDGARAPLLACDLHLPLTLPNLLYEVDLRWEGRQLRGLALAGLPVMVAGTNGHVAWGVTDLSADVLDVVGVPSPGACTTRTERIRVRGRPDTHLEVSTYDSMPVSPTPLLGAAAAMRWTGHDPRACDLRFQRLAHATSVAGGLAVLDGAQGMALNVLVADGAGRMAHVATGLLPRLTAGGPARAGGDHLEGTERPRLVDPPGRVLVSANDAGLPEDGHRIVYDPDPGDRARRIRAVLAAAPEGAHHRPESMRALQHDTLVERYEHYRDIALAALGASDAAEAALIRSWDGTADAGSRAFGVLVVFRQLVATRVLTPYLARCRDHDPGFVFSFRSLDRPVLAVLRARDPALLPAGAGGWQPFVRRCVLDAFAESRAAGGGRLPRWGALNAIGLQHPLAGLAPWAGRLLGIPSRPQPGALHAVRACAPGFGANGRAVLSPGPGGVAEFDMPAGQSGHPLDRHYDDRHVAWAGAGRRRGRGRRDRRVMVLEPGAPP